MYHGILKRRVVKIKTSEKIIMSILLLFSIFATTVVWSAFNTKLQISGEAILRIEDEIRITGIEKKEYINGAFEKYNSKYSKDTVSIYVTLPANSSITYEVEITNKSLKIDYEVDDIISLSNNNPNIVVDSSNINKWDNINKSSNKKFYITLKNNTSLEQEIALVNQYKFSAVSLPVLVSFYNETNYSDLKIKFHDDMYRQKIKEVFLSTVSSLDEIAVPNEGTVVWWNLDVADKGKIIGYLVENEESKKTSKTMYDLHIVGYNEIIANARSGWLFGNLTNAEKINGLDILDTKSITSMNYMFAESKLLRTLNVSNFNTKNVTSMVRTFANCTALESLDVSSFNTGNVRNMNSMFVGCRSLKTLDLSGFDTSNVSNMILMFSGCNSLEKLDLSNFNTKKVTNMGYMFYDCGSLTNLDVSSFDTINVTDMHCMFGGCNVLKKLDISNFNTSKVTTMDHMFYGCGSLTNLDVSSFDTKNVTDMNYMFAHCIGLVNLDVSVLNTSNVTTMFSMFSGCSQLISLDISNFDTKNVTGMSFMFATCYELTKLYVGDNWDTSNVVESVEMFLDCFKLSGAISYDSSKKDVSMANYTNGYLTYKA